LINKYLPFIFSFELEEVVKGIDEDEGGVDPIVKLLPVLLSAMVN